MDVPQIILVVLQCSEDEGCIFFIVMQGPVDGRGI
jgi:hypothetical protein